MRGRIVRFIVLVSCLGIPATAFAAQPTLIAEKVEADFGEVVQGKKVEQVFRFRNGGNAELVITQVRSSCGCTAALLSADRLLPGGIGELRAVFDSSHFRGKVSKNITLTSNDQLNPEVTFRLHGTVRPEIDLAPAQVDLGVVTPGAVREVRVAITNRGQRTVVLSEAKATAPEMQARLDSGPLAPGQSRTLVVRIASGAGTKSLSGYILLTAAGAQMPDIRIPVYGIVSSVQ